MGGSGARRRVVADAEMMTQIAGKDGFIAALDQSGDEAGSASALRRP
jgi:hypothetical protein